MTATQLKVEMPSIEPAGDVVLEFAAIDADALALV